MGSTLRHVIFDVGGGIKDGREFKAVQIGGPSGGCVPASLLDTPVDYESLAATGAIMGSGGMVVMDDTTCMVDIAKLLPAIHPERESAASACPAASAPSACSRSSSASPRARAETATSTARDARRDDQEDEPLRPRPDGAEPGAHHAQVLPRRVRGAHRRARCPALSCEALIAYSIDPEACTGCTLCARMPGDAITRREEQPHVIDQDAVHQVRLLPRRPASSTP